MKHPENDTPKRGPGRPSQDMIRQCITMGEDDRTFLMELGSGFVSVGLRIAVKKLRSSKRP